MLVRVFAARAEALPASQAYSKRWIRPRDSTLSLPDVTGGLRPQTSSSLPMTKTISLSQLTYAGYKPAGGSVTEDQIKSAKHLAQSETRVKSLIRDPVVIRACQRVGVLPEELIPNPRMKLPLAEGKAYALSAEQAKEQEESQLLRLAKRLALVLAERDNIVAEEEEAKRKADAAAKRMLDTFTREMEMEAALIAKEERELAKLAQVIALEQADAEARREKLNAKEMKRRELLQARESALAEQKDALAKRARERDSLIAKRAEAIKSMEREVVAELEEKWEEKQRKIAAIRELKEKERAAFKAAKEAEMARKEVVVQKGKQMMEEDRAAAEARIRQKVRGSVASGGGRCVLSAVVPGFTQVELCASSGRQCFGVIGFM